MYLILIDSRVRDIPSIVSSLTTDTEYITFDFFADTIQSIQDKITKQYDSVAIIQHNNEFDQYRLVRDSSDAIVYNLETSDPELTTWQQYFDFLLWLKNERGAAYIDLMACNLWANPGWRYMIETARSSRGIYLRASIDITGAGGDFILESDNFDTIGVYFTADILNYKYAFYSQPYQNATVNYSAYTLPSSNLAKVSTRYKPLLGSSSATTYTNVTQVVSSDSASVIVLSDGNAYVVGVNNGVYTKYLMPSGIVTQSDLVNISRVISEQYNFVAIKNDGTIVCWGLSAYLGGDINITNTYSIGVNDVRSQLTNVIDAAISRSQSFAALKSDGSVVTWGEINKGGDKKTAATYLSSGITNIYPYSEGFFALKNDGTAVRWGTNGAVYSTTYFTSATPIVDVFVSYFDSYSLCLRKNGNTFDLVLFPSSSTVYYTLPVGVTILRKQNNWKGYTSNFFLLFSNNTLGTLIGTTWTLYTNVTDVAVSDNGGSGAFAYIQDGVVKVGGDTSIGGSLTDATYGLKSGANLTNPVRLVSSGMSIGCIKSDNTFVWWGRIDVPYVTTYYGATFPTDSTQTTLYNAYNGLSVSSVYQCVQGYAIVKQNGSIATLGPNGANGFTNTTYYDTKDASMNVYFEIAGLGFIALEIPYLPSVSPTSINVQQQSSVSYYVSNPDKMAYVGRIYKLYNGATLIDTFIPKRNTHTYVFSNVLMTTGGTITFTIKDESTISYTVDTFTMTVIDVYPCFLEGSKILRFNPDSYQDEYIAVEKLRVGDLVATAESGYKAVHSIGYRTLYHPKTDPNPSNRLYRFNCHKCSGHKCSGHKFNGKDVFEPLYITGEHCTLHRKISEDKRKLIKEHMGDVYITEEFYRMPAFLDDRAEPYDREDKPETIWHFALENENVAHNYGVYANGLLVESCAIESLVEKSGMVLISECD